MSFTALVLVADCSKCLVHRLKMHVYQSESLFSEQQQTSSMMNAAESHDKSTQTQLHSLTTAVTTIILGNGISWQA